MKIVEDVEKASYNPDVVIGVDPGSVNTGIVVVKQGVIVDSFTCKDSNTFYTHFAYSSYTGDSDILVVFERPFSRSNVNSFGMTMQVIGYIKGMFYFLLHDTANPECLFVEPKDGNDVIGLKRASTSDIAKMNMAFVNGWDLRTPHEVSAYATVLAAEKKGLFQWAK